MEYHFIRRVAKAGRVYMITLPPIFGQALHGRYVEIVIKPIESGETPSKVVAREQGA